MSLRASLCYFGAAPAALAPTAAPVVAGAKPSGDKDPFDVDLVLSGWIVEEHYVEAPRNGVADVLASQVTAIALVEPADLALCGDLLSEFASLLIMGTVPDDPPILRTGLRAEEETLRDLPRLRGGLGGRRPFAHRPDLIGDG